MEMTTPAAPPVLGSRWGADGLYYPAEEERAVPLSGAAVRLIFYLYAALRQHLYPRNPLVYVAADQFIYYAPHDPTRKIAPDVWACFGVPQEPERAVFRPWEEGATPGFVVEVSSKGSRSEDCGFKFDLYQDTLRCREYLIYDEDRDELLLYRLEADRFQLVVPGPDGRLRSQELGVSFAREPDILVRIFGPDGEPLPTVEETADHARVLEGIGRRLAEEVETERRRADALAAELARLHAELARLRQLPGEPSEPTSR